MQNNTEIHSMNEEVSLESIKPEKHEISSEPPQDEGYAWVVLFFAAIDALFAFGSFSSFGVFQTYYLKVMFVNEPAEKIAWIGTCFGMLLASFSTKIWQLALTQGLIFGLGSSLIISVYLTVSTLWFNKHRSLIMGILASSGGLGGLVLIPLTNKLLVSSSIQWSFRIYGIMFFVCTFIAGIILKPRTEYKPSGKIIDFKLLKDPIAITLYMAGFFSQTGIFTVIMYFPSSLVDNVGTDRKLATNLLMVFVSTAVIGRTGTGFLAKKFDSVKIMIIGHLLCGILMMSMWYTTKNFTVYLVFLILFAISSSPYLTLSPIIAATHFSVQKLAQVNAFTYMFMGLSIFMGLPTLGLIYEKLGKRSEYTQIITMAAICYFLSAIFLVLLKIAINRKSKRIAEETSA
ncbi:hypothetical protein BB559_002145 [Furculomyces boomerangus]|uniref:Major facilitator superfamily (MFS) profile domain-containing protein n=1 Tax=Furculomyces boomerangus TaxID=61424 RepID=A0A2T9YXN9_9FUNG|nr:hypothetical protein BB559_002145 [Furculomyces boomerangus]